MEQRVKIDRRWVDSQPTQLTSNAVEGEEADDDA
jgi:hypothetical protein